ncbi:MAG: T9SS type A sorting domain-containing protein, partial [Bacteroidota bacterium]
LTTFDARLQENQTHLTWRTASEKDNAGFEIERSNDGTDWQTLAFVPGNGTTSEPHDYHFTDENPQPGDNYYRLKQLDFSGAAEYSDTRHVRLASGKLEDVLVSPNPVPAGQTLSVSNPLEGAGGDGIESVQLMDVLGRIVWEGSQFEGEKLEISLPPDLSKGLCWLVLNGGGERVVRKVLVQ